MNIESSMEQLVTSGDRLKYIRVSLTPKPYKY